MRARGLAWLFVALASTVAHAQAPDPIAERFVTYRDRTTRTTFFANRTVVVSIRENDRQGFVGRITLDEADFAVYVNIIMAGAKELGDNPISSKVDTAEANVTLILRIGPDAPRILRFSPMAVVSLPLSRILGALDDIEEQVLTASPSTEEVRSWVPKKGNRVQLFSGAHAVVVEVWEDGTIVLEHEDTFIREIVPVDVRDEVILHVSEGGS
jgi:hypothetical protein